MSNGRVCCIGNVVGPRPVGDGVLGVVADNSRSLKWRVRLKCSRGRKLTKKVTTTNWLIRKTCKRFVVCAKSGVSMLYVIFACCPRLLALNYLLNLTRRVARSACDWCIELIMFEQAKLEWIKYCWQNERPSRSVPIHSLRHAERVLRSTGAATRRSATACRQLRSPLRRTPPLDDQP